MAKKKATRKITDKEIAATVETEQLAQTVAELTGRLGQDRLIQDAVGLASVYGRQAGTRAVKVARDNPQTAMVAGAGAALLAFGAVKMMKRSAPTPESRIRALEARLAEAGAQVGSEARAQARGVARTAKTQVNESLSATETGQRLLAALEAGSGKTSARAPVWIGLGALVAGALTMALQGDPRDPDEDAENAARLEELTGLDTDDMDPATVEKLLHALDAA